MSQSKQVGIIIATLVIGFVVFVLISIAINDKRDNDRLRSMKSQHESESARRARNIEAMQRALDATERLESLR